MAEIAACFFQYYMYIIIRMQIYDVLCTELDVDDLRLFQTN